MEKIKYIFGSLFFNIAETILIFLVGKLLSLPTNFIIIVMLTFMISRGFFGKALHFKAWYRCLIWSCLILLSLFLILKIDLKISILFAIFSAFIMTGKSNINDMYLWKPKNESKYYDIEEYIKYHEFDKELIEFEENIQKKDKVLFLMYKYRFKEHKTFSEISELLDIETNRITTELDKIAFGMRIFCKI